MKVRELIQELQKMPQDMHVYQEGCGSLESDPLRVTRVDKVKIARWESHHDEVEGLGPTYNTWVHDGVDYYDDYHHIKEVVYIGHDLMKWYKEEIDHLRNCYYNGVPEISDKAYDELIRSYNEDKKRFEEAE